jgi:uncharacterized protein YjbI with pentapeptide repeats
MANEEHVKLVKEGLEAWNVWRGENPDIWPDLSEANLERANLSKVSLDAETIDGADLTGVIGYP